MVATQNTRLLEWLQTKSIDPMTALNKLGIYRLSARIQNLRDSGVSITTHKKKVKTTTGEAIVALYKLEVKK